MVAHARGAAVLGLFLVALCVAAPAHGLELTRDENSAVLDAALADPDAGFHSWALRHSKPYAVQLRPILAALAPHAQLATPAGGPSASNALPEHAIINQLLARSAADGGMSGSGRNGWQVVTAGQEQWLQATLATYAERRAAWVDNARFAAEYNRQGPVDGHWLGLTSLADLRFEEYTRLLGTRVRADPHAGVDDHREPGFMYDHVDVSTLPRDLDWRNHSAVSHVKNQGMCGSCWSFATTGAIEGINALYTKRLSVLSEQELVDCDRDVDMGCSGGMMDNAYAWIIQHKGVHLESDWPYLGQEDPLGCDMDVHERGRVVTIDAFQGVPVGDEAALLKAVAHQPVAVAVEADTRVFQLYMGGVLRDPACGSNLNHGVLVVGYGGLDNGQFPGPKPVDPAGGPYWIVKNSWGPAWGQAGYIRIGMGYTDETSGVQGLCGITLASSFPIKRHPNPPAPKPGPKPPKPPPVGPVACDAAFACPADTTCCCMDPPARPEAARPGTAAAATALPVWGRAPALRPTVGASNACSTWGCCPMVSAVCCADRVHCCPSELPVCDVDQGRCLPKTTKGAFSLPWFRSLDLAQPIKRPAARQASTSKQDSRQEAVASS